jgi:hypothetical protein
MQKNRQQARERRRFPRKATRVRVRLRALKDDQVIFEAVLSSGDVSIGGMFLESEFFVRTGARLRAEFQLEPSAPPVEVAGVVVRQERLSGRGGMRSGFALQFVDYFGDAKLQLARHFLLPRLARFVEDYLASGRASRVRGERDRLQDILVAWELARIEKGEAPFTP